MERLEGARPISCIATGVGHKARGCSRSNAQVFKKMVSSCVALESPIPAVPTPNKPLEMSEGTPLVSSRHLGLARLSRINSTRCLVVQVDGKSPLSDVRRSYLLDGSLAGCKRLYVCISSRNWTTRLNTTHNYIHRQCRNRSANFFLLIR